MKKFLRITLSLVLAVILFATAMPIYAVEDTTVEEIEELREENVKHFKMNDGTYKAVVYSEPVHRRDADGNWQDIDNTLSADNESNYVTSDGRVKFSRNVKKSGGSLFELSENGYKISLSLIEENIKSASARIKNHGGKRTPTVFDSEKEKLEKLKEVDNLTRVRYNDITEDVDIEYEIYSNNIKESIIVNSGKDSYVYKFELKLNKMTATLNEDGEISLNDEKTGEVKYIMPAPFMFDDSGALSTDVYYTLTQSGKYKYELTVTASAEWINEKDRDFPVTIDPTININTSYGEAYVSSSNPNTNYKKPSNGQLLVSTTHRTFLKFEMPTLSASATILDAVIDLKFYFANGGNANIYAYTVPYSWNENTITWNNSVASHTSLESSVTPFASEYLSSSNGTESDPAFMYLDMTSVVRDWYDYKDNYGIAIKSTSGTVIFKGYNSGEGLRPTMEFTYQESNNALNGTYFFRSVEHNTYMQDSSATSSEDDIMIHPFDGDVNQKWIIKYLRNGYYKITTADGTKALTAPSTTGGSVALTTYTASSYQMWSITQDISGNYSFASRFHYSYYLSSGSNVSTSGVGPAELRDYMWDDSSRWILYQVVTNGPQLIGQKKEKWCWAACAWMLSSAYITPPISLESVAVSTKLGYFVPNPSINQENQCNHTANGDADFFNSLGYIFGKVSVKRETSGYMVEDSLKAFLDNGIPIMANLHKTDLTGDHFVLIHDYYIDENDVLVIRMYDPLPVNCGQTQEVSFDDLTDVSKGNEYIWSGFVIIDRGSNYEFIVDN